MASKTYSIQLTNGVSQALDEACRHYRWRRSQGVAEFIRFYTRLQEFCKDYSISNNCVFVDLGEGRFESIEGENAEAVLKSVLANVKAGLLAAFRDDVELDAQLESIGEEGEE